VELSVAHFIKLGLSEHHNLLVYVLIESLERANHGTLSLYLGIGLQHLLLEVVEQVCALLYSQPLLHQLLIVGLDEVGDIALYACLKGHYLLRNLTEVLEGKAHVIVQGAHARIQSNHFFLLLTLPDPQKIDPFLYLICTMLVSADLYVISSSKICTMSISLFWMSSKILG